MVALARLPLLDNKAAQGYRLINSKFPPIYLFDDVASPEEFELLYELQARTNPRLQNEVGRLELIAIQDIPFGIPGCAYATAPFTHINPYGSRFSSGQFGILYIADTMETAIAEVKYHQQRYWQKVEQLNFERFVLRGIHITFKQTGMQDLTHLPRDHPIYHPNDYSNAQALGQQAYEQRHVGFKYHSVRAPKHYCWALFTPKTVTACVQSAHYEMIWDGENISSVNKLSRAV